MAYLNSFDYDVFISYAHVDNWTAERDARKGWISQFHQYLEVQLSKRIGRMGVIRVWRDASLDGSQLFDQTIEEKVTHSALFLALTSTGYLESAYCGRELECFHREARSSGAGLSAGDRLRIFNVLLSNVPIHNWPAQYGRTSGFVFHDAQREDDLGEPSDPADKPFHLQLRALVDAMYRTLTAMKEPAAAAPSQNVVSTAPSDGAVVFVADTADTLRGTRKRLVNELRQQPDIRVVENVPPPHDYSPHDTKAVAEIKKAVLSVHLLDGYPGREIENGPGFSYAQRQATLAVCHGQAPFIWVPQDLAREQVEDPDHKALLDLLETREIAKHDPKPRSVLLDELTSALRGNAHYDFVRGSPSSVVREVLERIEQIRAQDASPAELSPAALLDTHVKDQIHALQLSSFLLEQQVQPYINPQEDDPRKNLKLFEERLKQVGILIVFFGVVAEEWVRARLAAAVQIAIAENCPLKACGVYVAPPKKSSANIQVGQRLFPVELMDNTERFDPASITRLLDKAGVARP